MITNYISVIPNELLDKTISLTTLNQAIHWLSDHIPNEYREFKWKKDYSTAEVFVNGISTSTGKYHLILPRFTYTISLKKKSHSMISNIANNAVLFSHINDTREYFETNDSYKDYLILVYTRRFARQTYKDKIESDLRIGDLLYEVHAYLDTELTNETLIKQIKKNSTRKVITEGSSLTTSEKKSISVKQSKQRNQEEIDYILEMNKQGLSSREIPVKFEEKFKKKISYRTVYRIIKQYKEI